MAIDHVKSTPVTNLDGSPIVINTAGEGGAAPVKELNALVTAPAGGSAASTYQFVRVPSNAKIKAIFYDSVAQAAGTIDIGIYYATDGVGGKPTSLLAANAIDQDLFASALALTSAFPTANVVNESGTYDGNVMNQPLWQAGGLASDPGGFFDIVGTLVVGITNGGKMNMMVLYTD